MSENSLLSQENLMRVTLLVEDPRRFCPLLYAALSIDSENGYSDWFAASLGDEAEMFVKRLLLDGIRHSGLLDLREYLRHRLQRLWSVHAETIH